MVWLGNVDALAIEEVGSITLRTDPLLTGTQPKLAPREIMSFIAITNAEGNDDVFSRGRFSADDEGTFRDIGIGSVTLIHWGTLTSSDRGNGFGVLNSIASKRHLGAAHQPRGQ